MLKTNAKIAKLLCKCSQLNTGQNWGYLQWIIACFGNVNKSVNDDRRADLLAKLKLYLFVDKQKCLKMLSTNDDRIFWAVIWEVNL